MVLMWLSTVGGVEMKKVIARLLVIVIEESVRMLPWLIAAILLWGWLHE
jgi:hypothetical protein